MLLPDHAQKSQSEINFMLEGYEDFREFDYFSLRCIEPPRAMRILYFMAWCSKQFHDPGFDTLFPDWGSDSFWAVEVDDLEKQLSIIHQDMEARMGY